MESENTKASQNTSVCSSDMMFNTKDGWITPEVKILFKKMKVTAKCCNPSRCVLKSKFCFSLKLEAGATEQAWTTTKVLENFQQFFTQFEKAKFWHHSQASTLKVLSASASDLSWAAQEFTILCEAKNGFEPRTEASKSKQELNFNIQLGNFLTKLFVFCVNTKTMEKLLDLFSIPFVDFFLCSVDDICLKKGALFLARDLKIEKKSIKHKLKSLESKLKTFGKNAKHIQRETNDLKKILHTVEEEEKSLKKNEKKPLTEKFLTTQHWVMLGPSYILIFSDTDSLSIKKVFLVDNQFRVDGVDSGHSKLKLSNAEGSITFYFFSSNDKNDWVKAIVDMNNKTVWSKTHRYKSFAPVRRNNYCEYFVDGEKYFWAVSERLDAAKSIVYIQDWYLSPEVYLRRPIEGNESYRLDKVLLKKASQGVIIRIIINKENPWFSSTDSAFAKSKLSLLHKNIFFMRHGKGLKAFTHHEKLLVIDNEIAFFGGIDLAFGRYDTEAHALIDENENVLKQNYPGIDYENDREKSYPKMKHPLKDSLDRKKSQREPWHDIGVMTIGQAARDLARHFVQTNNHVSESKWSKKLILLVPPADFTDDELQALAAKNKTEGIQLEYDCQLLRSAGPWLLGLNTVECSIQNAFIRVIETSEHCIYIQNQFFITACKPGKTFIQNKIGEAIVKRILRAFKEKTPWKAYIVIPLMPGFPHDILEDKAFALREMLFMHFLSIQEKDGSILEMLNKKDIVSADYVQICSLRNWSTIGPQSSLVTEQIYIHAKMMIVDDRKCLIGSANINDRSMQGNKDTEIAVLIEDTRFVKSQMNGAVYYAGVLSNRLRQETSREIFGCNLKLINYVEATFANYRKYAIANYGELHTVACQSQNTVSQDEYVDSAVIEIAMSNAFGIGCTTQWGSVNKQDVSSHAKIIDTPLEDFPPLEQHNLFFALNAEQLAASMYTLDIDDIKKANPLKSLLYLQKTPFSQSTKNQIVAKNGSFLSLEHFICRAFKLANMTDPFQFFDPLSEFLWLKIWQATASKNTKIYKYACRCEPDDFIRNKSEHIAFQKYQQIFSKLQDNTTSNEKLDEIFRKADEIILLKITHENERNAFLGLFPTCNENKRNQRKVDSEALLKNLKGHLVEYPAAWLEQIIEDGELFSFYEKNIFARYGFK